jgi:hypothetical protein
MGKKNLPAKKTVADVAGQAWDKAGWVLTPAGWVLYKVVKEVTKSDHERQMDAILKAKKNGMEHGEVEMSSRRVVQIEAAGKGRAGYAQEHKTKAKW